ncbi:MAG: DUF4296 domain-containing protein [Cytophagales bacterium]|nr:MAG: DUF4296 domain-containing protein [Cytophagales bacterium]
MKIKIIYFTLLSLVLFACNNASKKPDHIIDEDKMVRLLIEIHICETKSTQSFLYGDTSKVVYAKLESELFKKMGVTKSNYEDSYQYYMKNLIEFDLMYSRVVDSLSLRESLRKI